MQLVISNDTTSCKLPHLTKQYCIYFFYISDGLHIVNPSNIYHPLYNKLDICTIIRDAYDPKKSGDAISPIPPKHNECAKAFMGFVDASTVYDKSIKPLCEIVDT